MSIFDFPENESLKLWSLMQRAISLNGDALHIMKQLISTLSDRMDAQKKLIDLVIAQNIDLKRRIEVLESNRIRLQGLDSDGV